MLLGALRDVLLANEVYVSCLGRTSCLYCESAGVRKDGPSPEMRVSILYCIGYVAV